MHHPPEPGLCPEFIHHHHCSLDALEARTLESLEEIQGWELLLPWREASKLAVFFPRSSILPFSIL